MVKYVKVCYAKEVVMRVKGNDSIIMLVLLLVGAIFGSLLGSALGDMIPVLNYGKSIGVDPFLVDLNVVQITFGFKLHLNVAGIVGIIAAFLVFKKL